MSTRKLIIAALLCGLAILVAFTVQVLQATSTRQAPPVVPLTAVPTTSR